MRLHLGWLLGSLLITSAPLRADNPYDYRYGSAAYERAAAGRKTDERLNAPVTNSAGYTPDFSSTLAEIRQTLGPKLTPEQIVLARRRAQAEAERDDDEGGLWSRPAASRAPEPEPPREPSYTAKLQTLASQGNTEAQRILGEAQINFTDLPDIYAQGLQYLENSAQHGNTDAAQTLIAHYNSHPKLNKFPRVLELMADLARRGDSHYVRELGLAYLNGVPGQVTADPVKALHFLNEGFTRWADGTCGLALARAYRDGRPFPQDTAKAIATYRQLIEAQSKRNDVTPPPRYNTAAAGWEWFQLEQQRDPDLHQVGPSELALWSYAALHGEKHTRAAAHRLAAALGNIYYEGSHGPVDPIKTIQFLSIATSGDYRGVVATEADEVVLSNADQARHLCVLAGLLLDASPTWPKIDHDHKLVASTPADIARLYSRACHYASLPDPENAANPYPQPFLELVRLSYDKAYGFALTDRERLALLDRGLDLGVVPNNRDDPQHLAYTEATYERARLIRGLGNLMPDTQHRAALAFQTAWEYGWKPAALPLAEMIDDHFLPPQKREDAKAICRIAAADGDAFCAAQLGTWLTGEVVAQAKPTPALVAEARQFLQQATDARILHAHEDLAVLNAALGEDTAAVAEFKTVLAGEPTPRAQAGFAELLASGRGGLAADPAAARLLLEKAAEEDAFHLLRLAQLHFRGEWGLPKNTAQGIDRLEEALIGRHEWHAGIELARIYHQGLGVPKDEAKAFESLEYAGNCGNNETARIIAEGYETGTLINPNPDSAAHWRKVAIEGLRL